MTKKEAISLLEGEIIRGRMAPKINGCPMTEDWQRTIEVCEIAIEAIKEQEQRRWIPVTDRPKENVMKCNQICKWNSNLGCVKPYGVPCMLENVSPTDKKATNADRIRSMTDEELSEFINALTVCDCCSYNGICSEYNNIPKCRKGVLEWLQQHTEGEKQ